MNKSEAHEANLDAAYREIEYREMQGEDMSNAVIDETTYAIEFLISTSTQR